MSPHDNSNENKKPEIFSQRIQEIHDIHDRLIVQGQFDKVLENAKNGLKIAKKNSLFSEVIQFTYKMALAQYFLGNFEDALTHLRKAKALGSSINDTAFLGKIALLFGNIRFNQGFFLDAKENYETALNHIKNSKDTSEFDVHVNLALISYNLGNFTEAIEKYETLITEGKDQPDSRKKIVIHGNIADCYFFLGDSNKAQLHYLQSIKFAKQLNDKLALGNVYCYYGYFLGIHGDFSENQRYLEKASHIANITKSQLLESEVQFHFAKLHLLKGQYQEALQNLSNVAQINEKHSISGKNFDILYLTIKINIIQNDIPQSEIILFDLWNLLSNNPSEISRVKTLLIRCDYAIAVHDLYNAFLFCLDALKIARKQQNLFIEGEILIRLTQIEIFFFYRSEEEDLHLQKALDYLDPIKRRTNAHNFPLLYKSASILETFILSLKSGENQETYSKTGINYLSKDILNISANDYNMIRYYLF